MPDRGDRTPEEREAARLERARLRASRLSPARPASRVTSTPPAQDPAPPVDPPVDPTVDPPVAPTVDSTVDSTLDPTVDLTVDPTVDPRVDPTLDLTLDSTVDTSVTAAEPPSASSRTPAGTPPTGAEPAAVSGRPPIRSFPSPPEPYQDEYDEPDGLRDLDRGGIAGLGERSLGTRRITRAQAGARAREHRAVKRRRPVTSRRPGHRWVGRIVALFALVLAAALIWLGVELFQPFGASPHGSVTVTIPAHQGAREIGDLLAREGVVASGLLFELRATLDGDRDDLRAGTYHLQLGMSYGAVLADLTRIPPAAKTTQLTISEGRTRQYVAALLHRQHITGNYLALTRSSRLLNPRQYGAPRRTHTLEGFLFPDTFTLVTPIKMSALVDDQLRDFKQRFATVNLSYARRQRLTPYDVLTIASLIEAEAASASARPLVASVIYNRLRDGMMLQLDSTARYATGNFTGPLTVSQLKSPSPYNTHTHFGLPPTPIDSPGLAAIEAAAHPARSPYLFFFSKPCSNQTAFATTYSRFLTLLRVDRRNHC
ncbi:MAG: endolytic transglycosylase MltG [Solirubrobacteraceae bacterium]